MIHIKHLSKIHSNGFRSLNDVNLIIEKGEFVYLVGPSGSGKTSLLNMIFRFEQPTSGDVCVDRFSLNKLTPKQLPFFRRNIGMVFQDYKLLPNRTVYENIAFALWVMKYSRSRIHRHVNL